MDIDEFLDREIKGAGISIKRPESGYKDIMFEHPDINDDANKLFKTDDFFSKIKQALDKKDFNTANKLHFDNWMKLSQKTGWNQKLHDDLIKSGIEIKSALNKVRYDLNKKKYLADNLFNRANENLKNGNYQAALSQYSELIEIHKEIPEFLFDEKRLMHNKVLRLYMELKEKIDMIFLDKFNSSFKQIKQLILNSRQNLKKREFDYGKNIYLDILKLYTNMPAGFISEKIDLGKEILDLYKEISISLEIKSLKGNLSMEKNNDHLEYQHRLGSLNKIGESYQNKIFSKNPNVNYKINKSKNNNAIKELKGLNKFGGNSDLKQSLVKRRLERGKLKTKRGLDNEAKRDFESALRLDPNNDEAKKFLSKINTK